MKLLPNVKFKLASPLIFFSIIIFFISLHDAIISYVTPIILNNTFRNTVIVGSILSISSLFGIFFNFFVSKYFHKKDYNFFTSWMLLFAFITPLIFLFLPKSILPFFIAMIVWSIYYEFRNYSKYDFVKKFLNPNKNAEAWATMTMFQSTAYMLGPIVAIFLISKSFTASLVGSLIIVLISTLSYLLFKSAFSKKVDKNKISEARSFFKELKIIHILARRIWPLVLFTFSLTLLDVSFWTMGVLYSQELKSQNEAGGLFVTIYCLPTILVGIITPRIYGFLGKKKTAFVAGILAGLGLLSVGIFNNIYMILGAVFFSAFFADISFILIFATFEDYVTRLDGEGNNLVSIGQISQNFAYVIGPILLGLLSAGGNFQMAFKVSGLVLFFVSLLAIAVVPRKIKMPHKEISAELI